MAGTVYLHVGTAKSGTTYLQRILARNRGLLKKNGVLYPGKGSSHFFASMDLRGATFKGHEYPGTAGAWDRLAGEVREYDGDALISHETLGSAQPKVIEKAVGCFPGSDVRVLVTCRDLGRQIPAGWQERVKNRNDQTYAVFLQDVFSEWNGEQTSFRSVFWRTQNVVALTRRWSRALGAENVLVVTVPLSGADPDELWRRFARAADLPDLDYDVSSEVRNASLGAAEAELLRRLNPKFPDDLTWPEYESRIKGRFVLRELAPHNTRGGLSVPEQWREPTEQVAAQMIEFLRDLGCPVVGDLEDLRPSFRSEASLPEEVSTDELLELSLQVLAEIASRPPFRRRDVSAREAGRIIARRLKNRTRRGR